MADILTKGVWVERIARLREAGVTDEQAEVIFGILDDARAFNSATLSARVRATWAGESRRGISHEYEPEADSLSYIDFEEDVPLGAIDRKRWHVEAARDVLKVAGLVLPEAGLAFRLNIEGETAFWRYIETEVNAAGFDTYNSDTRFEVFPHGTPRYEAPVFVPERVR